MRIIVNDIAASEGGARTILENFHKHVLESDKTNEWIFLVGDDIISESNNIKVKVLKDVKQSWLRRIAFDFITGRRYLNSLNPDVLFSLQNTYTYGVKCPQAIYVHQSIPFQRVKKFSILRKNEQKLAVYQYLIGSLIKMSIRKADKTIVQSKWMHEAILERNLTSSQKIQHVLPDLEDLKSFKSNNDIKGNSFFYPTSQAIYKNNECIFNACKILRSHNETTFSVKMTIPFPVQTPEITPLGRITRDEVLDTLAESTLVFPSLIETYGLPLAEARSLGVIVLAADLPYAREVLEGYSNSYFFDPHSPEQLATLMEKVIKGEIVRKDEATPMTSPPQTAWKSIIQSLTSIAQNRNDKL